MKTKLYIALLLAVCSLAMVACSEQTIGVAPVQNVNQNLEKLQLTDASDNALAVIVNNLTDEQLSTVDALASLNTDQSNEQLLIIPRYESMNIEVVKVQMENGKLVEDYVIYSQNNVTTGYGLLLTAYRPEGVPSIKIVISDFNDDSLRGEYIVAYDGKEGTPDLEYIESK